MMNWRLCPVSTHYICKCNTFIIYYLIVYISGKYYAYYHFYYKNVIFDLTLIIDTNNVFKTPPKEQFFL